MTRDDRHPLTRSAIVLLAASLVACVGPAHAQDADDEAPVRTNLEERVEVRAAQLVVSVTDPSSETRASIPGLTKDHFEILIDGRRLEGEALERVAVDEICGPDARPTQAIPLEGEETAIARAVIAVVDFNYMRARGRHAVARALEELADSLEDSLSAVKVYGYTRHVHALTEGFTRDPESLRAAAQAVRETYYTEQEIEPPGDLGGSPFDSVSASADDPGSEVPVGSPFEPAFRQVTQAGVSLNELNEDPATFEVDLRLWEPTIRERDREATASLAALRSIMLANARLPGQTSLVLFTGEAFRLIEDDRLQAVLGPVRDIARREGFSIWTVDVEGLAGRARSDSELVSALAMDTGGGTIRRSGALARAFTRAEEQLSCYYLLTIPIRVPRDETIERSVVVKLNTERYPEMWRMRVDAPPRVRLPSRTDRLREQRISALMSPNDFSQPRIGATLLYPETVQDRVVVRGYARVPLRELEWTPRPSGGVEARVLFDSIIERATPTGSDIVCEVGTETLGPLEVRLRRPPSGDQALAVELPCALEDDGFHVLRAVVTDLANDRIGAARSGALIRRAKRDEPWATYEPRVRASSGEDFIWLPGLSAAQRDTTRRAWRPIGTAPAAAHADDRIVFSFVLCGSEAERFDDVRVVLARFAEDASATLFQSFASKAVRALGPVDDRGSFCTPVEVEVPPFSLEEGRYGFAVLAPGASPQAGLSALAPDDDPGNPEDADDEGRKALLGTALFDLRP